ncbi:hypothetical protein ACTFIY_000608 [Dictyostelium cf. discoideum]
MNKSIKLFICFFATLVCITIAYPTSYYIPNVPYHRQETQYNCGDASLQMVLEYYGRKIDQLEIDDVARTSNKVGTSSYDIIRTPRFSVMSASQGTDEKEHEVKHGFKGHPLGLLSVGYSSANLWLDELKSLVANDIPVIVLMAYLPTDLGGHFRVIVGYDDEQEIIYSNDPWDRDGQPRLFNMSYTEFTQLWNYTEPQSPRGTPFFGSIMFPLTMESSSQQLSGTNQTKITASFSYDSPFPIDNINATLPTGLSALTSLILPNGAILAQNLPDQQSSYVTPTSQLSQGSSNSFSWIIECENTCGGYSYQVETEIVITDSVPLTYFRNSYSFPTYTYMDIVGNTITSSI